MSAVLVAAGCGGGDGGSSGTTGGSTAAQVWANSLCQAVVSWNGSIVSAGATLKDDPTEEGLKNAADEVQSATQTLSDDLKELGTPDTQSGEQAKESVDDLAGQLEAGLTDIESTVDQASGLSGAPTAISTVSSTLVAMGDQVKSTVRRLEQIDAQGELAEAFREASACDDVAGTISGSS